MSVKTISFFAHHTDTFSILATMSDGSEIENSGYAPHIPAVCSGDDTEFVVDNETGKIVGWVPLTKEELEHLITKM